MCVWRESVCVCACVTERGSDRGRESMRAKEREGVIGGERERVRERKRYV